MSAYSAEAIWTARSFLFVPGSRPDRFAKAASAGADVVIVDLEDAVAPADKDAARAHARAWLRAGNAAMLRINGTDTQWHGGDTELVDELGPAVMLPKAETIEQVYSVAALHAGDVVVVPLVETAAGVLNAEALGAEKGVVRLAFGSIDLAAQLGVEPDDREALVFARSRLVMASAASRCAPPIDGVTTSISTPDATVDDVRHARRLGMSGKLCIHPNQVAPLHAALAPSDEAITWARRVLAAADAGGAAVAVDGHMVDAPVLDRARRMLAQAGL